MANVKLRDGAFEWQEYEDVASVSLPKADGTGTVTFYADGGGGAEFSINVGDSVSSVFFNTRHSTTALDTYLSSTADYPYKDTSMGFDLPFNILLTATGDTPLVFIASLPAAFNSAKIIYAMGQVPIIFYSTAAFDASSIIPELVVSQGWQMDSFSAGFEVEITNIESDFIAVKDTYFAKSAEAFGTWTPGGSGGGTLQSKTITLGADDPSGTIEPEPGYDGFNEVTVAIDSTAISASKIAKGSKLLGLNGSAIIPPGWEGYMSHTKTATGNLYTVDFVASMSVISENTACFVFPAADLKTYFNKSGYGTGSAIFLIGEAGHKKGDQFSFAGGWLD